MYIFLLLLFSLCSSEVISAAVNTTSNQFQILKDKDQITSGDGNFKLGFFSPPDSTNRYVGIWYNADYKSLEVVWVANRENPVKGSDGVLKLSKDGNLQVLDRQNKVYWSSNTSQSGSSDSWVAEFQAGGNLVLVSTTGGNVIWQSFTHPTNSLLSSMKIGVYDTKNINNNTSTQTQQVLQSWKSPSDPSRGRFTLGIAPSTTYDVYVWDDNGKPYWRTGPWNGNSFLGVPATYYSGMINTFTVDPDGSDQWLKYVPQQTAVLDHYVLDSDGKVLHKVQRENQVIWRSIESDCDVYGKCGPFGKCNSTDSPICSCLDGFEPTNEKEWKRGNWTSGCSRRTPLQCDNERENTDGFLRVPNVKIPAQGKSTYTMNQEECRKMCLEQCSCLAYAYYVGIACMNWNQSLIDTQEFNVTAVDLFIRLAQSEIAALTDKNTTTPQPHNKNSKWKTILVVCLITGAIILAFIGFYVWRKTNRRKEWKYSKRKDSLPYSNTNSSELDFKSAEFKDLPLFKLEMLAVATRDFHLSNKLGEGGFGPVFKGKLEDGQEIAVKRLARASGQGLQEFMNEVLLISKLQHRNLVRLLGCCIQGEEKLLVYEYMPNKSLDALLFDPTHRQLLDWKTRFNIIKGILRGLLYLHRDSRLRIIHRDLKASNILLDEELNPKISDFGMAKIFEAKEDQGKTSRIVGTYGYMSPEYAMEGNFSEKSDVYSFGVLLLEIVSGRRNRSFKEEDESSGLIGYVWKLWNDGNALSLIDPIISDACFQEEIFKCIYIGLLCVQEFPEDRPTISTIISMLDNETSELPRVTQPGITQRRSFLLPTDTPHTGQQWEVNEEYGKYLRCVADKLFRSLSLGLGLEGHELKEAAGGDNLQYLSKINYYPPCPRPDLALGVTAHSDMSAITLLVPNEVPGLQISLDDCWHDVKYIPNAIIIHIGDQIEIMSNGKYKSVLHRTTLDKERTRMSWPVFLETPRDQTIGPIAQLINEENPAKYKSKKYHEYVYCKLNRLPQ